MSNDELVSLTAVELRRRIGTKEISPVELLEACLERIEEVNPAVNAVTAMSVKRARKEARLPRPQCELRRRIGTKEISPVELLEACIERIERSTRRSMPSPRCR